VDLLVFIVDDELGFGISAQDAPNIADVVQQAGDDEMAVIVRFDATGERKALQQVATDQGHEKGVLEIVVERIAPANAFNGATGERSQSFGDLVMDRAEDLAKILRQESAQLLRR
jgi:hypothetical protein